MKEASVERKPLAVEGNKGNKYQRNGLLLGPTRASVVQHTGPLAWGMKMGNKQQAATAQRLSSLSMIALIHSMRAHPTVYCAY